MEPVVVVALFVILIGGPVLAIAYNRANPTPPAPKREAPQGSVLMAMTLTVVGIITLFFIIAVLDARFGLDLWWTINPLTFLIFWVIAVPIVERRILTEFYAIVPTRRDRVAFYGAFAVLLLVGLWHRGEGTLWMQILSLIVGGVAAYGFAFVFGGPTLRRFIRENVWTFKRKQE